MQKITSVATEEARLDLLAAQASGASRSQAARWIEQGLCRVNGAVRQKPAFKVGAGDALELTVPDAEETPVEKEDIPLEILYEDADLAVVSSRAAWWCTPPRAMKAARWSTPCSTTWRTSAASAG